MISFKDFLNEQYIIEAKIDDFKAQEKSIPIDHDPNARFTKPHEIIDHFHSFNPTGNVEHTRWMVNRYKQGQMKQEDAPAMKETLESFEKNKNLLPKKNIHQYKTIEDLRDTLRPFQTEKSNSNTRSREVQDGADLVHDGDKVKLWHVHTMPASMELGKGMPWCTSNRDPRYNMFDHYNEESNNRFYIAHLNGEEAPYRRLGIGVGTREFQDENNKRMSHEELSDLVKRNPELGKIPQLQGARVATTQDHDKHFEDLAENDSENIEHVKNLSDETIQKALKSGWDHKMKIAAKLAKGQQLDDIIKNSRLANYAYSNNKNIQPHHIDDALDNGSEYSLAAALKNPVASSEQLKKGYLKSFSPDFFEEAAEKIRQSVAQHPNTPQHILHEMMDSDSIVNSGVAAANPNVSKEKLLGFIKNQMTDHRDDDKNERLEALIENNKNLPKEAVDILINHPQLTDRIIKHQKNITTDHLKGTFNLPDESLQAYHGRLAAVRHPDADNEVLQLGLRPQEHETIRATAAIHPNLDPETIHKIILNKDEDTLVRKNAASNPSASSEALHDALDDERPIVRNSALDNPNVKPEHFIKVLGKKPTSEQDKTTLNYAFQHRRLNTEGFRTALNNVNFFLKDREIKDHHRFRDGFIKNQLLSRDEKDYEGARKIAPLITEPHQFELAVQHPEASVRAGVVLNRNTPPDIMRRLTNDPHPGIAEMAKFSVNKNSGKE